MEEKRERKEKKEPVLLLCLTSTLQPVWLGRPYQEYNNSSQHSYPGHWGTQSSHHEKVTAHEGIMIYNTMIMSLFVLVTETKIE